MGPRHGDAVRLRATTAVILARGLGTRMRAEDGAALTQAQRAAAVAGAKGLMPVAGYPLLDHLLHALADGGVTDVVFVVAPSETALRDRYGRAQVPRRIQVRFAEQVEAHGTADALLAARHAVAACGPHDEAGVAHFLLLNADNLYPAESVRALVDLDGPGLIAFEAEALSSAGNIEPERVRAFALVKLSGVDDLSDIIEKPLADHPLLLAPERWVSMNLWRFDSGIFNDCARVRRSVRGELELTDAVRGAISRGVRFRALRQRLPVLDLSRRGDVATVEARMRGRVPAP